MGRRLVEMIEGHYSEGDPQGLQGVVTPVSLRYPLSGFNKNYTHRQVVLPNRAGWSRLHDCNRNRRVFILGATGWNKKKIPVHLNLSNCSRVELLGCERGEGAERERTKGSEILRAEKKRNKE